MVGWQTPLISNLFPLWFLWTPALIILQLLSIMGACFTSLSVPLYWIFLYPCNMYLFVTVHDFCRCSSYRYLFCCLFSNYLFWYPLILYNISCYMIKICFYSTKGWHHNTLILSHSEVLMRTNLIWWNVYLCVNMFYYLNRDDEELLSGLAAPVGRYF